MMNMKKIFALILAAALLFGSFNVIFAEGETEESVQETVEIVEAEKTEAPKEKAAPKTEKEEPAEQKAEPAQNVPEQRETEEQPERETVPEREAEPESEEQPVEKEPVEENPAEETLSEEEPGDGSEEIVPEKPVEEEPGEQPEQEEQPETSGDGTEQPDEPEQPEETEPVEEEESEPVPEEELWPDEELPLLEGEEELPEEVPEATYVLRIPSSMEIAYGATSTAIGNVTVSESAGFAENVDLKVSVSYSAFTAPNVSTTIPFKLVGGWSDSTTGNIVSGDTLTFYGKADGTLNQQAGSGKNLQSLNVSITSNDWNKALGGKYSATISFSAEVVRPEVVE